MKRSEIEGHLLHSSACSPPSRITPGLNLAGVHPGYRSRGTIYDTMFRYSAAVNCGTSVKRSPTKP